MNTDTSSIVKILRRGIRRLYPLDSVVIPDDDPKSFVSSSHPRREILFVLDGVSRYMLGNQVYEAAPGDFFLVDRWVPHAFGYRACDSNLLHLWGSVEQAETTAAIIRVGLGGQYSIAYKYMPFERDISSLLARKWNKFDAVHPTSGSAGSAVLLPALNLFLEEAACLISESDSPETSSASEVISSIRNYICDVNTRGCSLKHLEKISGYSSTYLAHRFQTETGMSIREYIGRIRMSFVRSAKEHGLKQKEIAAELGFSSPTAFWLWLRKHKDSAL